MSGPLLYPNVGGVPGQVIQKDPAQAPDRARDPSGVKPPENFQNVLNDALITEPLKFSAHASARVQSRNLNLGPDQMRRLNEAVDKAAAKGLDDTLILTKDAAFIVNVKNRTVVTAMDRNSIDGNVFTNIDGAVII